MKGLTGTATMIRFTLRRDRLIIPLYVTVFVALVVIQAASSEGLYATQAEREAYAATAGNNPALIALTGPAHAIDTVGGDVAWNLGGFGGAIVAVVSLLLVGRHSRAEEQSGRSELLKANVLGRYAHPTAALTVVSGANILLATATALGLIGLGLPVAGSIAFGVSMGAVGLLFAGVGTVAAQVTENTSTVYGIGGAVLGLSYLLRAAGDVGDGTLSWFSPIGWGQAMRPFADERWWPLLLFVGASVVLVALAFSLMARRDDGAGLVPARLGPAAASTGLTRPLGLALRLQRGLLIGWSMGLFIGGLAMGSVGQEVESLLGESTMTENLIGHSGAAGMVDSFFATILLMMAMIGTVYAVQSALRMRSEEAAGRIEPLLATAISRWRWVGSQMMVTMVGSAIVLAACGLGTGLAHALLSDDPVQIARLLGAQLASLPAVWVVAALAVALFGLVPRAASLAWAALAGCLFLGLLGPLLQLPEWAMDLSPFTHIPQVPAADLSVTPLAVLASVAAMLTIVGLSAFRRRDIYA